MECNLNETNKKLSAIARSLRELVCNTTTTAGIDPEVVCISNDGGVTVISGWEVFDTSTNPPTSRLYLAGIDVTATYTVVPCGDTTPTETYIDKVCLCDDNAGILTSFVRFYTYDPVTDTRNYTGDWLPDLSAPYTPTGIVGPCDTLGTPTQLVLRKIDLTGIQVWNKPPTVVSFTLKVRRVGDVVTPPTTTDNAGFISTLYIGDVDTYSIPNGNHTILEGNFSINLNHTADLISLTYLELV